VATNVLDGCVQVTVTRSDGSNATQHSFFANAFAPPSLTHLLTLFAERHYALWKPTDVVRAQ
jgi:hypothetical protein